VQDIYVIVSWLAPFDNHVPITAYRVELENASGLFEEMVDLCDGSDREGLEEQFCKIPMHEFWQPRLNKAAGDIVKAKVVAINERGESVISLENTTGALVQTVPFEMIAVTDGDNTSGRQVHVRWTAPLDGLSAIQSYEL
jgi:hypothetical protein